MKKIQFSALLLPALLAACANTSQPGMDAKATSAAAGAAIGCVGGALLAKVTGQNAARGCALGALAGGLIGFEKARQEEIAAAAKAQQDAIAALSTLPPTTTAIAKAGEVKTVEVTATDKATNESRKYQAFDSVTVDIPMSAKGTPQYEEAIGKLKTLAERVADERGSSRIEIAMTSADARANKVSLETASVKTAKGSTITVSKIADNSVPRGVERFTVRAAPLRTLEV